MIDIFAEIIFKDMEKSENSRPEPPVTCTQLDSRKVLIWEMIFFFVLENNFFLDRGNSMLDILHAFQLEHRLRSNQK